MTFYNLIMACKRAVSQSEIKRLLHQSKDDADIQELFRLMLCPSIVYNIKKVPFSPRSWGNPIMSDRELILYVHELISLELRGKVLKGRVSMIHNSCIKDLSAVMNWILARKNPAKVGKSFVNAVWPNLVRTQKYMGAVPGSEESLERLFREAPYVNVQDKIDGQTGLVDYDKGIPQSMHTRQGNRIDQFFPGFMADLPHVAEFTGMVHHELLVQGYDRAAGNGIINKQIKNGTIGGTVDSYLHSVLLDFYSETHPTCDQDMRYKILSSFVSNVTTRVYQEPMTSLEDARKRAKYLINAGGEGVVCKHPSMPFKNGKHWNNVKIKNEFTVDLEVIDWKMHTVGPTKLGALLMATDDGDSSKLLVWVNLKCDEDRRLSGQACMGDILKVKAECVTTSKSKSTSSLSLPRFDGDSYLEYKHEKIEADSLMMVLEQEEASKAL